MAVIVLRAPSFRVVRLGLQPDVDPAVQWERLAVWCAIRGLPDPATAGQCSWGDHDSAAGTAREVAVGCRVGPGIATAGEFVVLDTPGGWCASAPLPADPAALAEAWQPDSGWRLVGRRSWCVDGQRYWPVQPAP